MDEKPKKELIRETIKDRLRAGAVLKKAALVLCFALIFGVAAAFAFAFSQPLFSDLLATEEPTTEIKIFEDEPTTEASEPTEVTTEEPTEGELSPSAEVYIDEKIDEKFTLKNFYTLYLNIAQKASKSIVRLSSKAEDNWLNQPVSVSSEYCGVVIAKVAGEVLILTSADDVKTSSEIYVSVSQDRVLGQIKGIDKDLGIAVVSVPLVDLNDNDKNVEPIAFGSSSLISQGVPVIALGKPTGVNGSIAYGLVSYTDNTINVIDAGVRAFQTDIMASKTSRGILVNTDGELVAVISSSAGSQINSDYITAIGLNDLKNIIENMSNGRATAELGVKGQTITRALLEQQGIPIGVYVTETISGKAAENAGILPGDVISYIDDKAINSLSQLTQTVQGYAAGSVVSVKVMRGNRENWTELEFTVPLGSR